MDSSDVSDGSDGDEWVEDGWPPAAVGGLLSAPTADGVPTATQVAADDQPPSLPSLHVRSADYLPTSADEFPFNVGELKFEGDDDVDMVALHAPSVSAGWAAAAARRAPENNTDGPRSGDGRLSSVGGQALSAQRPSSATDPSPLPMGGVADPFAPPAKESCEDDSLVDENGEPLPEHHIRRRLSTTWRYKLRYARDLMAAGAAGPARGGLENLRPYVAAAAAARTCTPCDGTGMAVCSYCKGAGFVRLGGRPGARVFSITHNHPTAPSASTAGGGGSAALSLGVPTPVPDPDVGMEDYLATVDPELVERLPGGGAAIVRLSRRPRPGASAKAAAAAAAIAGTPADAPARATDARDKTGVVASKAAAGAPATPGASPSPRRRGRPRKGQEAAVTQPLTPLPGSLAARLADGVINTGFVNTTDFRGLEDSYRARDA
ncbi:hypothetical protein MMPV_004169 [Pyropia vietnamensis]